MIVSVHLLLFRYIRNDANGHDVFYSIKIIVETKYFLSICLIPGTFEIGPN